MGTFKVGFYITVKNLGQLTQCEGEAEGIPEDRFGSSDLDTCVHSGTLLIQGEALHLEVMI